MLSTQRVKISGDGAKMSRITNFVVLSFSLLSDGKKSCLQMVSATYDICIYSFVYECLN